MLKKAARSTLAASGLGLAAYSLLRLRSRPMPSHPFLQRESGLLVMAHRGGGGLWPQNTLYAFECAVDLGVDVLELDIHATADGVLVVMHDDTVDATTSGTGAIRSMTLAEIKALDAGYRWTPDGVTFPYRAQGITVPTLEEILAAFPGMRLNIDIKQAAPSIVEPFCRLLREYDSLERVMVGSFHDSQLRLFRRECPEAGSIAGLQETRLFYLLNRASLGSVYRPAAHAFQIPEYSGDRRVVTPRFIQAAHAHNMEVHVWTVDETADMRRLMDWGVDGLITDRPDRLMALLGR